MTEGPDRGMTEGPGRGMTEGPDRGMTEGSEREGQGGTAGRTAPCDHLARPLSFLHLLVTGRTGDPWQGKSLLLLGAAAPHRFVGLGFLPLPFRERVGVRGQGASGHDREVCSGRKRTPTAKSSGRGPDPVSASWVGKRGRVACSRGGAKAPRSNVPSPRPSPTGRGSMPAACPHFCRIRSCSH